LECPSVECGNRQRAFFVFARLRNPHPSGGAAGWQRAELSRQGTPLVGCERFDLVTPRGVLAWVTRRTASSFAARDFKRSFWSLWTLRISPACEALQIRRSSLNTATSSLRQGSWCHSYVAVIDSLMMCSLYLVALHATQPHVCLHILRLSQRRWLLTCSLLVRHAVGTCSVGLTVPGEDARGYSVPDSGLAMDVG
jgi:hypothetical protein